MDENKGMSSRAKGFIILIVLLIVVAIAVAIRNNDGGLVKFNANDVYGAVGGGKENLLNDPDFNKILN